MAGLSKRWLNFAGERRKNRFYLILSLLFYQFLLCEAAWEHGGGLCLLELEIMSCSPGFGFLVSIAILITSCWIFSWNCNFIRVVSISYSCLNVILLCYHKMHKRKVFNFVIFIITINIIIISSSISTFHFHFKITAVLLIRVSDSFKETKNGKLAS